jgi:hypothetical protein
VPRPAPTPRSGTCRSQQPDDHLPDLDDTADFELPDQQALIDAFTAGLRVCKESQHDFHSLSTLLATLPDPSLSYGHVKAQKETVPQCGGAPGRPVRPRPPARLHTALSGVASADGPADGPGCCALDAAPRTARPGPARCRATTVDCGRIDCHNQIDQVNRRHDVLREVLQVGVNLGMVSLHMIDI